VYTYDLEKAKALLSEAGLSNGFSLTMYYFSGYESIRQMVSVWQSSLAQVGITLNTRSFPWDEYFSNCVNNATAPDIDIHAWDPTYPDPFDYLYGLFDSSSIGIFNWSFYSNPEVDQLLADGYATSSTDRAGAMKMYRAAEDIIIQDAPTIFTVQWTKICAHRAWVKGWTFNPYHEYWVYFYDIYKEV